jgi:hypothetical protein
MLPDAPVFAVFLAAGVLSTFGVIAGTFVSLGLALRIALPGNR